MNPVNQQDAPQKMKKSEKMESFIFILAVNANICMEA